MRTKLSQMWRTKPTNYGNFDEIGLKNKMNLVDYLRMAKIDTYNMNLGKS